LTGAKNKIMGRLHKSIFLMNIPMNH